MVKKYIPKRGDLLWINFNPQSGREQKGKRPALVVSSSEYNKVSGLIVVCPITSHTKMYPFEVSLHDNRIEGVILSDQIKNFDWETRGAKFIEKVNTNTLESVLHKISELLLSRK